MPVPRPLGEELFGTRPLISRRRPIFLTLLASILLWPHEGDQKATSVGKLHQEANRESFKTETRTEAKVLDSQAVPG